NIHKRQTLNIRRISPFGIAPAKKKKKAHKARTLWYRGQFRRYVNTRLRRRRRRRKRRKKKRKEKRERESI
ncbi:hypothetical protein, partial [Thiolapillus sp.]|uniref:hypothetical protein n=1 Tax=Thiolapillus sp. TaxID=2017437 RepID=UPI003AF44E46